MNKLLLAFAAFAEVATGLALMVVPPLVGRLLLGVELSGVAVPVARVTGAGLFSLGLACWPARGPNRAALCGMLAYDLLVGLYFVLLGIRGEFVGPLLWPAAAVHLILGVLLAREWMQKLKPVAANEGQHPAAPQ